jgi:hypothetical protein
MKLYTYRNEYRIFQKAKIEVDTAMELTLLHLALHYRIEDYKNKGAVDNKEYLAMLSLQDSLNINREIPWDGVK